MKTLDLLVLNKVVATFPHLGTGPSARFQFCMILLLLAARELALFISSFLHLSRDGRHVGLAEGVCATESRGYTD